MGLVRFALALSVVFWHIRGAPFHLINAAVAVSLFFIIPGFYMAMVINEKYANGESGSRRSTWHASGASIRPTS